MAVCVRADIRLPAITEYFSIFSFHIAIFITITDITITPLISLAAIIDTLSAA